MLLRYANVMDALSRIGVSIRKIEGEYQVVPQKLQWDEDATYFTDDLEDAYFAGIRMAHKS